ncbi:hypothetical protein Zmor_001339 [Zophobas morio]|uniref:CRAL-TRIO domain-containing protein n=1 Tax=Zophobas morio TaxID=2755281 RepID=A0AA38MSA1_9CUCU|nr:hypothetical protein Zmor_001339 [Zophobas morio]
MTPEGYTILLTGLLDHRPEKYNYNNELLLLNLVYCLHVHKYGFAEGVIVIVDLQGGSLGHLARVNLSSQKCMFEHLQEGMPIRLKSIHVINAVPFMDKVMALVKPLMSSKLFQMVQIHSTLDSLYDYVPRECLPVDYGGEGPSRQAMQEEMIDDIFHNVNFFNWHDLQTVDESKRVEKSNIGGSNFGAEGTFKKLEID